MRRILKITGNIYMPMKPGETLEEASDRFDDILDNGEFEFASYTPVIVDDDGNEIKEEGE